MLAMLSMVEHYTKKELARHKDLAGYLNDVQEELMDAILYIQAAREELAEDDKENILGVNSPLPESFRPPHPSTQHN